MNVLEDAFYTVGETLLNIPSDHETFLKCIKSVGIKRFKTVRKLLKITKILNEYLFVYPKSTRASTRENTFLK
jgi:hypothetical protein